MIIYMQPRGMTAVRNCNHLHLGLNGYHFSYDIFGQHIRQKSVKQHRIKKIEALALGQSPLGILKELAKMEEDEK